MSENYRGVTFAEQGVTPADDAMVRNAILSDGVLAGCEITYSGSTLTMSSGFLIACGRTFQNVSARNWPVVDATSGYARLIFTIDLSKTATEETFDQVDSVIEYATALDGFVDLDQSDINLSGTRYQMEACVVSLGSGGITRIVSQIGRASLKQGELVWQNADISSDFPEQSIPIDLSDCSHIMVDFVGAVPSIIAKKGTMTYANHMNVTSTATNNIVIEMRRRAVDVNDERVLFSACNATMYLATTGKFSALSENKASVKPVRIYGLKGVS